MLKICYQIFTLILIKYNPIDTIICSEHTSCVSPSVAPTSETHRFTSKLPTWFETCNCDENCYSYGDCCLDSPSVTSMPLNQWSLLSIKVSPKFSYTVLMKSKCAADYSNAKLKKFCENIGSDEKQELLPEYAHHISLNNDEFLLWYVSSKSTKITYRNIYCAVCNNETTDLQSWDHKLRCVRWENGTKCSHVYFPTPPDFLVQEKIKRKPIQIQITTSCNIGWYKTNVRENATKTMEIVKNCARFYAPVAVQDDKNKKLIPFKNEYCALCSGYLSEQLVCPVTTNINFQHQLPTYFDINTNFDTNLLSGGRINSNESCLSGHVYDPYQNKCRLILVTDDEKMITDSESESSVTTEEDYDSNLDDMEPEKIDTEMCKFPSNEKENPIEAQAPVIGDHNISFSVFSNTCKLLLTFSVLFHLILKL